MVKLVGVTVVIIVHNEAENLRQLLPSLAGAAKVIVVGHRCSDDSAAVAKQAGAQWLTSKATSFAEVRNLALRHVSTPWLFYVDADERVTPLLWAEIADRLVSGSPVAAYSLRRVNYHYGVKMSHGGWDQEVVVRLFRVADFEGWTGEIHESPHWRGQVEQLTNPLIHFTHRETATNLVKSSQWTIKEAQLLYAAGVRVSRPSTIVRKVIMEFYRRFWRARGYRDGMAGFVESLVQAFNRGFVYIQVWELGQQPTIADRYATLERAVQTGEI